MRKCSNCKIIKPLIEFNRNRTRKTGYDYLCLACGRIRDAAKRLKFRKLRALDKSYIPYNLRRKKPVTQYTLDGKKIKLFRGATEASEATGIIATSINRAASRGRITAGGFLWRYTSIDYDLGEIVFCQCCGKEVEPDLSVNISINCLRELKGYN